jgi:type IV secretion system protein VirB4
MLIDDGAAGLVADLGSCLREIEINGNYFGKFSLTIILYDQDRARLRRAVAECFKVLSTHDAVLIEERYNLLNAFLAVIPGNRAYNLRRLWLMNTNYADLSFLFMARTGETHNAHLDREYLAVLETDSATPYFLNLHYQDVAHSMILGATGSGKSFFLNFLLTNLQKYEPPTYIFDLGGSYEWLTRLFGGSYQPVLPVPDGGEPPFPFLIRESPDRVRGLHDDGSGGARSVRTDQQHLRNRSRSAAPVHPGQHPPPRPCGAAA